MVLRLRLVSISLPTFTTYLQLKLYLHYYWILFYFFAKFEILNKKARNAFQELSV